MTLDDYVQEHDKPKCVICLAPQCEEVNEGYKRGVKPALLIGYLISQGHVITRNNWKTHQESHIGKQ